MKSLLRIFLVFCLAVVCLTAFSACGDDLGVTTTTTQVTTTELVTTTAPVTTAASGNTSDEGTYAYVVREAAPSVVAIHCANVGFGCEETRGSGVVIRVDREAGYTYIVTTYYVVNGCNTFIVYPYDSAEGYAAELCGGDWVSDVAVIRVKGTDFNVAAIGDSRQLVLGQEVAAVGHPLGVLGGAVTGGFISSLGKPVEIEDIVMTLIQHSALVGAGNSGGALFDLYGRLIGIVTVKTMGVSVGYAIPINLALDRAEQIIEKGYVDGTPYLGIRYSQAASSGLVISGYEFNAELEASGQATLQSGDILVALNGEAVNSVAGVRSVLSKCKIGDVVVAQITRRTGTQNGSFTVNLEIHAYGDVAPEP